MKLNFLFLTKFLVIVFLAFCAFGFVACGDDDDGPTVDSAIVGIWISPDYELTINSNGTAVSVYTFSNGSRTYNGTCSTSGGKLTTTFNNTTLTFTYRLSEDGDTLFLINTDNGQDGSGSYTRKK
jgi:hypothetical protein